MDRSQAESEVLSAAVTHSWNSSAQHAGGTQRSLHEDLDRSQRVAATVRQEGKNWRSARCR